MKIGNRKCIQCGAAVTGKKLYCAKCKKERDNYSKSKDFAIKKECTKRAEATKKSLNDILREAKKLNMTYGQYMAFCQRKGSKKMIHENGQNYDYEYPEQMKDEEYWERRC